MWFKQLIQWKIVEKFRIGLTGTEIKDKIDCRREKNF
jgi:hypothetical protein